MGLQIFLNYFHLTLTSQGKLLSSFVIAFIILIYSV